MIGIFLIGLAIFCAEGCSTSESFTFNLPNCFESHAPSIGKDLVVGESSDELIRKVGEPNQTLEEKGYTYYVYYLLRGFDSKHLLLCDRAPTEDWSAYIVALDADRKVRSVVYDMFADADSQRVRVPGADGLMLPATLYRPRGCGTSREPAIVLLHGWLDKGATDTGLGFEAQMLAEHGYVVLMPLMRGWGGGQHRHGLALHAVVSGRPLTLEWGGGQIDCGLSQSADTVRMIEWLASQPGVDPDRIGVMGFSFGGQVALLTGALTHRAKAIVSDSGPTDWVSLNARMPWYASYPEACQSDLKSRSPVTVASQIKAPVLLIQGDADTAVPSDQAEEMEQALWRSGGSVELYLVSGAEHVDGDKVFFDSWTTSQQFLEANLGKPSCVQTLHAPSASAQPTTR